jgi:hypothetical protein
MTLTLLYRGPLSSCNYGCTYCPFAKKKESRAEVLRDKEALARFAAWVTGAGQRPLSVLFTPWGEGLTRKHYRDTLAQLTHLDHVASIGIQTNLSGPLDFIRESKAERLRLWCTYHPEWTTQSRFLERVKTLRTQGVSLSVGIVGFRRFIPEIEAMRALLPSDVYLWVNVPKRAHEALDEAELERLRAVDPYVDWNADAHLSRGERCGAGEVALSVDGEGNVRRCHFLEERLGNLYQDALDAMLKPRTCPARACGCHIGYVHLEKLELHSLFGEEVLFRTPPSWPLNESQRAYVLAQKPRLRSRLSVVA